MYALVLRQMFDIELTEFFGEVPGTVIGKEGEYGALGRIAMEWVLTFRRRLGGRSSGSGRISRNRLGACGGTEGQPGTEKRHGEMSGRRRKNVPAGRRLR